MTSVAKLLQISAKKFANRRKSEWYNAHMAAATRAVAARISLVDLVVEVRDAREWLKYFEQLEYNAYGVNSHNLEHIQKFLNFLQAHIKALKKTGTSTHTNTILLVGVPNVGKSALANSLHQVGRVSATEKGKLKRATVSPLPGETKDISSMKVGSHPNVYVLDTPGILPASIPNDEVYAKLCLTGAIRDCMVEDTDLAQTLMGIVDLSNDFMEWGKHSSSCITNIDSKFTSVTKPNETRQHLTDHTQDHIVNDVRAILFDTISAHKNSLEDMISLSQLVEHQFTMLQDAFGIHEDSKSEAFRKVAVKLLNLFRYGRLGHYSLDSVPLSTLRP
uniref:G domain-containing protein n=1 Tax=Kalanchoe fedtschenkoi TaxID=63787 RepID=A0A7N0VLI1_KALFE